MERASVRDLIIIGAGPAGMSAAIYASRAGLDTMMLEEGAPGGKLTKTHMINNYPGVGELKGFELAGNMFKHAQSFGAEYVYGSVDKLENDGDIKKIVCKDGNEYLAKNVIIATGTRERLLNIPGEKENIGKGVSYCAVCDGGFFKDKTVAVIGGGNSALDEALYLTQFVKKLYIVIRRDVFRANEETVKKVEQNEKIEIIKKHIPIEIKGNGEKVEKIVLKSVENDEEKEVAVDGVFPYIGSDPITEFADSLNICNEYGYVKVDNNMETSVTGIFAAGDVREKNLRQVVTATNDGAIAAQEVADRMIKNKN